MKFKLEFDCGNAAFDDDLRDSEVCRILRDLAEFVETHTLDYAKGLYDINGNRVGTAEFTRD